MNTFTQMTNDVIRIGLEHDASSMKRLCQLSYPNLSKYGIISYYKLCAISRAAGILTNRKKSLKRGYSTKDPLVRKDILISCYGFKIKESFLKVPMGKRQYQNILLNQHTAKILSDPSIRIRSFTLTTNNTLSICYSKEVLEIECSDTIGIDRNMRNVTVGNEKHIAQYDLSKAVRITEITRDIKRSFKRNDVRIRKKLYSKYGKRRKNRINQILHRVSKDIVEYAKSNRAAVVFEDIANIRRLYRRGNGQGSRYRGQMNNAWSFHEIERLVKYKAAWEGLPVIQLSKGETRGTSKLCPQCGKRTQEAKRDDKLHYRQLWCRNCQRWQDRDIVAAMNLSLRGRLRFDRSQGVTGEAMVQEPASKEAVILKVDVAKSDMTEPSNQYIPTVV